MSGSADTRPGLAAVITTIQPPTPAMRALAGVLAARSVPLVVVGDEKGPAGYDTPGTMFLPLEHQGGLGFQLAELLPRGHYARKNLGYLWAIEQGAGSIYETDDDNQPLDSWAPRAEETECVEAAGDGWVNAYRWFSESRIWPRGFPLEEVSGSFAAPLKVDGATSSRRAPIQQGLSAGAADVDAIWRLALDQPVAFRATASLHLRPGSWCPFNSQSTWWWPAAYPLLYLPSHCSFRMTDIWRSFVAQRCLWELGAGIVFHAPEVRQERNPHDLMQDFAQEIDGYLHNRRIGEILSGLSLDRGRSSVGRNLERCYRALVEAGLLPATELELVAAWLADLEAIDPE